MTPAVAAALLLFAASPSVVSRVRVDAPPATAERLQRFLEIAPGQPLDPIRVRHVVELIHATGEFQDVVVETSETAGGIEVVFRPVAAPRLVAVKVEGDRVIKPEEARRRTRLRPREPLWPGRLETAGRDLALRLVERGWLEARVEAEARPTTAGADAVFTIHAGPRAHVSATRIEGGGGLRTLLEGRAQPRPGDVFSRGRAQRAAESMRLYLASLGYWRARVEPRESYDPASGRVDLAFAVSAGPLVTVEVEGPAAARALRRRVQSALREGAVKADAVEEGNDILDDALRRLGHREVAVTHREQPRPGGIAVVYAVNPGPLARVASVSVAGDDTADLARLVATRAGEPLVDDRVAEDVRALVRALEDRGHPAPRVEAEVKDGGGDLAVIFRVHAGPAIRVSSLSVASPQPLPEDSAPQELRLRAGRPYRVRDLALDRDTVLAAYRDAGYLQADVEPEVAFSEDRTEARVVLRVHPGRPTTVDHVVIAGLDATNEEVVRRELLLKEGEPLGLRRVLDSQHRLGALGLFDRVSITEMDPESEGARSVVVQAEESPRTSVAYGLGYAEQERLRASVEVTRRNLFGMDRRISVFARASLRPGFRLVTTYREPYLFGRKQELFVTGYREDEDRPAFSFVRQGITVQTARPLSSTWNLILRETYEEGRTFNTAEDCLSLGREFCPHTISGPSASLVIDTRDDALDPTRGHVLVTDAQLSLRALGGNTLAKGFVQGSTYQLLRVGTVVALSARLGLSRTFGRDEPILLPKPDRFFAGGDYTLRGFATDQVRPDGGNAILLGGAELRHRLAGALWVAAFTEAGNVYRLSSDMSLSDLRYTAGLGLRYRSAIGPLRFDWGYKLDRRPNEKASHVHFTVGHAF